MKDVRACNLLLSCNLLNTSDISASSLNPKIIFEKLLEMLMVNDLVPPVHMFIKKLNMILKL